MATSDRAREEEGLSKSEAVAWALTDTRTWQVGHTYDVVQLIAEAIDGAVEEEREACAGVADAEEVPEGDCPGFGPEASELAVAAVKSTKHNIAAAIRALGEK